MFEKANRSETRPWYEEWFDRDEYELVYPHRDEREAEDCIDLLERTVEPEPHAQILDVGCGRGRHARVLARRGYLVTGIDLAARAIEQARERTAKAGLTVLFEQKDMRKPYCTKCFDGAVNLFSSFGYFEEEQDHARAIQAIAAALRTGGWFFQDFMNAPHVRRTLVPEDTRTTDGIEIHQKRWIEDGRINKEITLRGDGEPRTFVESVRLLTLEDFQKLYAEAGLELETTFGDYDGQPHSDDSPRLILYARKP